MIGDVRFPNLTRAIFNLNGKVPWTIGYNAYKFQMIDQYLKNGSFNDGKLCTGYGFRVDERIIEYPWLFSRLPEFPGTLLDAGSTLNHKLILNQPKLQNKNVFISTLSPEENCFWSDGISYVYEDVRDSCYKDYLFDWIACISTLEHIGLNNTILYPGEKAKEEQDTSSYLDAILEFHRLLKPRGKLFLTIPFGIRDIRSWVRVFDKDEVDHILMTFNPYRYKMWVFRYTKDGWTPSSMEISKDSGIYDPNFNKTRPEDNRAFAGSVLCLEMMR